MKETKKETVVVTEYTTDFGTKFTNKDLCRACENQEYADAIVSLFFSADEEQRVLLNAMVEELSKHFSSAHCEQGISNDGLGYIILSLTHDGKSLLG